MGASLGTSESLSPQPLQQVPTLTVRAGDENVLVEAGLWLHWNGLSGQYVVRVLNVGIYEKLNAVVASLCAI